MGKRDVIFLAGLLVTGALLFFMFRVNRAQGKMVVVRVSGHEYGSYDLNMDQTVEIQGKDGGTNLLVIRDGSASITQASCPDLLCVHQKEVRLEGESIICLPNEVVVEITGGKEEPEYDAIAG